MAAPPLRLTLEHPHSVSQWPRGLQPHLLLATPVGVELVYEVPDGTRHSVLVRPGNPPRISAQSSHNEAVMRRLLAAVARRVRLDPPFVAWVKTVVEALNRDDVVEAADYLNLASRLPASQALPPLPPLLAQLRDRDDLAGVFAPLEFAVKRPRVSVGEPGTDLGAILGAAFHHRASGQVEHFNRVLARAARTPGLSDAERTELANLLQRWNAVELIPELVDDHLLQRRTNFRTSLVAVLGLRKAGADPDAIAHAMKRLGDRANTPEEKLMYADAVLNGGDFDGGARILEAALDDDALSRDQRLDALRQLGNLALWAKRLDEASAWASQILELEADDLVGLRIRGAARFLGGDLQAAYDDFQAADPERQDNETKLWLSEVLYAMGRSGEAKLLVVDVHYGDFPVWQISKSLIRWEPREKPGAPDTWFIATHSIKQVLGPDEPLTPSRHHGDSPALLAKTLERFGGNRAKRATLLREDGSLIWADDIRSPRRHAEELQLTLGERPVDDVLGEFLELEKTYSDVPFYGTYAAEILMWMGRYEESLEHFDRLWEVFRTRWGYVGAGACCALLGRDEQAMQYFEDGFKIYSYLPAEASYCYRAEMHMRAGRMDLAREDLEQVVEARPTRAGGWIIRAMWGLEMGELDLIAPTRQALLSLVPAYCSLVESKTPWGDEPEVQRAFFERFLTLLRGNRSSTMFSIVDDDGEFRVLPTTPQRVQVQWARACLPFTRDAIVRAVAASALGQ